MKKNNKIEKIQEEYFEFCLGLLQKVPTEFINIEELAVRTFWFRDQLRKEIEEHLKNSNSEAVKAIQEEIEKLKATIQNKTPDT